jgi:2-amino-4-hydroxy-6-hydroxymethyldihydropteridine diphosphokinase
MPTVYIALGTNLGKRMENLAKAENALKQIAIVISKSSVYETPPWGYFEQPAFLNQVLEIETSLEPEDLLYELKKIEEKLGRKESFRYGPRLIDLDILFYDNIVYNSDKLSIPHPQIVNRAFILTPLADLAPEMVHPVEKRTISELLVDVDKSGILKFRDVL